MAPLDSPTSVEHHCFFITAIDNVIGGLKDPMEQPGYAIYSHFEQLLTNSCRELTSILSWPQFLLWIVYIMRAWLQPQQNKSASLNLYIQYRFKFMSIIRAQAHATNLTTVLVFTSATHHSLWLDLIQQAEVWHISRNITIQETQDYICSFRDGQQCAFGEVCKILQLVLAMPATNCTCESVLTSTMYYMCTRKNWCTGPHQYLGWVCCWVWAASLDIWEDNSSDNCN